MTALLYIVLGVYLLLVFLLKVQEDRDKVSPPTNYQPINHSAACNWYWETSDYGR